MNYFFYQINNLINCGPDTGIDVMDKEHFLQHVLNMFKYRYYINLEEKCKELKRKNNILEIIELSIKIANEHFFNEYDFFEPAVIDEYAKAKKTSSLDIQMQINQFDIKRETIRNDSEFIRSADKSKITFLLVKLLLQSYADAPIQETEYYSSSIQPLGVDAPSSASIESHMRHKYIHSAIGSIFAPQKCVNSRGNNSLNIYKAFSPFHTSSLLASNNAPYVMGYNNEKPSNDTDDSEDEDDQMYLIYGLDGYERLNRYDYYSYYNDYKNSLDESYSRPNKDKSRSNDKTNLQNFFGNYLKYYSKLIEAKGVTLDQKIVNDYLSETLYHIKYYERMVTHIQNNAFFSVYNLYELSLLENIYAMDIYLAKLLELSSDYKRPLTMKDPLEKMKINHNVWCSMNTLLSINSSVFKVFTIYMNEVYYPALYLICWALLELSGCDLRQVKDIVNSTAEGTKWSNFRKLTNEYSHEHSVNPLITRKEIVAKEVSYVNNFLRSIYTKDGIDKRLNKAMRFVDSINFSSSQELSVLHSYEEFIDIYNYMGY